MRYEVVHGERQGPLIAVADDVQRIREVIPGIDGDENRHRGDRRLEQREDDPVECVKSAGAVDCGRFVEFPWQRPDEPAHDEDGKWQVERRQK